MKIVVIEKNYLYAVKYDGNDTDEYNRIFDYLTDFEQVLDFFETYKWQINDYYVKQLDLPATETQAYATRLVQDALELEEKFEELIDDSIKIGNSCLRDHFELLEGFEKEDTPALKSYGLDHPSLIRVYAIEVDRRCLIIFYGGIKIRHALSECPILKDNVVQKARDVITYLEKMGVTTTEELNEITE